MKRVLFSLLLSFTLLLTYSCNTEKDEAIEFSTDQPLSSKGLVFDLEGVFPKNNRFELFYSADQNFDGKRMLRQAIYGESIVQKIIFKLNDNNKPQNLRLDLGSNEYQLYVLMKNIVIKDNGEVILDGINENYNIGENKLLLSRKLLNNEV